MFVLMIWEGSEISYFRMFVFLGGIMTVVFGLLSAFVRGLAYVTVYFPPPGMGPPVIGGFGVLSFQIHGFTFGMLVSTVGGLLGLISSIKRYNELVSIGFVGGFLGASGFLFHPPGFSSPLTGEYRFNILWLGSCLVLIGISLMLIGLTAISKGWHYLTLLGIPPLLISRLTFPLSILSNNLPLFSSIHKSAQMNVLLFFSIIIGYALTFLGSAIGAWKFRTGLRKISHTYER